MVEKPRQLDDVLTRYRGVLADLGVRAEKIYLFGSHRCGNPREDSDIDLIVVSPDFEPLDLVERSRVLGIAAARILEPIEARGFTPREISENELSTFWHHILNEESVAV